MSQDMENLMEQSKSSPRGFIIAIELHYPLSIQLPETAVSRFQWH